MADEVGSEQLEKRAPDTPEPDPIADRSMSGALLVSSLLLIVVMGWSLFDEVIGQRPWKSYQSDFVDKYSTYLKGIKPQQSEAEKEVKDSPEYQELDRAYQGAVKGAESEVKEINSKIRAIDQKVTDITEPFQNARAWVSAKTYELEVAGSESSKKSIQRSIEERRKEKIDISIHNDAGALEDKELDYNELEALYNGLRDEKAQLTARLIEARKEQTEALTERDNYLQNHLTGLTGPQVEQLINKMDKFDYTIKQIHVAEADLVDRCESCHLGVREPVTLTADNKSIGDPAFVSHPNKDLLQIHPPERFGCSTCHGGNGRGTTSVEKAHGRYKHWLWPLYYKENVEAGCNQCHNRDRVTAGADALNQGKDLFQNAGCTGCHRYEGFDRETDALASASQTITQLEMERQARLREIREATDAADKAETNEAARELLRRANSLEQMISKIDNRIDELEIQSKYLMQDRKKVGPNLKEIRAKLRKDWVPVWLRDPQAFRPGTKMPSFRLDDDEIRAISAFIWQSALDVRVAGQPQGDPSHGKELFKTIGCLACHSVDGRAIDLGDGTIGGDFAANLSRVGEKANYDYIVRWIHNPRRRLAPYSPSLKRDLTPADYSQKGQPFVFDEAHSKSPVDGRELLVHNMTVMPNFRLSEQDARDIATFLTSLKRSEPEYPDASFMDDTSLAAQGEILVKRYGCAGCHEIKGLEDEQRIGTELTPEGSKPIERLDFALLTEPAKMGLDPFTGKDVERGKWYDHKGFFENKLRSPGIYDVGKERTPEERLRMPNIYLEEDEITALTTFLLGSVVTALPETIRYSPEGGQKAVQDGWWVVQKYNCMGCHNVLIGQDSVLMGMAMYQTGDGKEQLPPRLTTEGARVNPDWLLKFLKDPSLNNGGGARPVTAQSLAAHLQGEGGQVEQAAYALASQSGANRNGVRAYLKARMPTFNFSPNELQALVNFFMGASSQRQPYIAERLDPLTSDEQGLARALFTSNAAPCLKCHMTGDPAHDAIATAPNFLLAPERLKPAWTERWLVHPELISPGTSMPSQLFVRDDEKDRWIFNGPTPPAFQSYDKDHATLLVRYMFQITPEEQRRLGTGGSSAPAASPVSVNSGPRADRLPRYASVRAP
ncbi:MAG: c-type cytochrome [Blastocatellia bacterium]|nr:c-type cytochrome [Blastocatellia bacterium]